MKQRSILWQAAGFAVTTLGGTLLHFLYDWTGGNILVAPFSGVNESTWEHMKLLFWPLFLFALIQRLFFKGQGNYWCVKLAEILLGLMLIPVMFYTYNGVFGQSADWIVPPKVATAKPAHCQRLDRCFIVPPRCVDTSSLCKQCPHLHYGIKKKAFRLPVDVIE